MLDSAGEPFKVALDPTLLAGSRAQRMSALASSALSEVLSQVPVNSRQARIPVFLGAPEFGSYFSREDQRSLCAAIASSVAALGQVDLYVTPEGNAAGVVAFQQAVAAIENGHTDCCAVGGVDSFIDADVLEHLDACGRLSCSGRRWGIQAGEGAGMLLLCSHAFSAQNRLRALSRVDGVALGQEEFHLQSRGVCVGVGLADVMSRAAGGSGRVTKQFCDIDGERYREHEFSYAILRVPESTFVNAVDYVAPADCWGSVGAATAPLLMTLAIVCHDRGASPGPRPMIWCGSDNGRRGAIVLRLSEGGQA
jgi:3-oxoacyl-[acyl-carrier-protein] synthase I